MERDSSRAYFRHREQSERLAAEQAYSPEARRAHLRLAELYAARLAGLEPKGRSDEPLKASSLNVVLQR